MPLYVKLRRVAGSSWRDYNRGRLAVLYLLLKSFGGIVGRVECFLEVGG